MNCLECGTTLLGRYQKKFCGHSCSALHNNTNRYDWDDVQKYYNEHTQAETRRKFGFAKRTWWKATTRGDIVSRGMDTMPLEDLKSRGPVRRRIIRDNLLLYECSTCGISKWRNKKLSLTLDHINGIADDHRIDNLRWMCPNCDSQLPTFAGRNVKR